jgi:hypothetical protein
MKSSVRFAEALTWWEQRRLRYNVALVIAGLVAFVCYVVVLDRGISSGAMPDAEITIFTTVFQGIGYIFMMVVANVCFLAGPLSEALIKPTKVLLYRRVMFQVGLWFSVLLPFTIPAYIAWDLMHPGRGSQPVP